MLEDTKVPFDELQAEQIGIFRDAWREAGHEREPRVSVSRSVIPITTDLDRQLFGRDANEDQVGWLDGAISRFGRTYSGEPDRIAAELAQDAAVAAADTLLLTVPNQLGVDYNARLLEHDRRARRAGDRLEPYSAGACRRLSAAMSSAVRSRPASSSIASIRSSSVAPASAPSIRVQPSSGGRFGKSRRRTWSSSGVRCGEFAGTVGLSYRRPARASDLRPTGAGRRSGPFSDS